MAYLCVDTWGEHIADEYPERGFREWKGWRDVYGETCNIIAVPKGTIKKLIGKEMTWEDEPIDLSEHLYINDEL